MRSWKASGEVKLNNFQIAWIHRNFRLEIINYRFPIFFALKVQSLSISQNFHFLGNTTKIFTLPGLEMKNFRFSRKRFSFYDKLFSRARQNKSTVWCRNVRITSETQLMPAKRSLSTPEFFNAALGRKTLNLSRATENLRTNCRKIQKPWLLGDAQCFISLSIVSSLSLH